MSKIPLQRGAVYEVTILDKIAAKGRGIARYKDFVIFVKNAVPGQQVKIQITRIKPNYAEGKVLELLKRSSLETAAVCSNFGSCGGCVWQNLEYKKQLELKYNQIKETIQHLGKIKKFELLPIIASPKIWEYRNKIELSFGYEKMWVENKDNVRIYHDENPCLGFHAADKWEQIVKLKNCRIFSSKVEKILEIFNNAVEKGDFEVFNPKTKQGLLRQLIVRSTADTENLLVNLVINSIKKDKLSDVSNTDKKLQYGLQFRSLIQNLSRIEGMQGVLITESSSMSDALINPKAELVWGVDCIYEKLGKLKFKISPFSFFQTNTKGAETLYDTIKLFSNLSGQENIIDLYCGTGAIALYLADKAKYVYGLEINADAIKDARENARLNDINNVEFICGAIEKELRTINAIIRDCRVDQIIVDPPRAGMHKSVVDALSKSGIKKIIYVSCNPATMARDIEKLARFGYELSRVQPVDMFPHTAHVEAVAELVKN